MPRSACAPRAGLLDAGRTPATTLQHRAAECRRRFGRVAVWVFVLHPGEDRRACWYWSCGAFDMEQLGRGFLTFDECVADARLHGFDFQQPYHVTARS